MRINIHDMIRLFAMQAACSLALLSFSWGAGAQQDSIQLQQCYDSAYRNYPVSRQTALIGLATELKLKNLQAQWLPQMSLNAQANYNSDVIHFSIDNPLLAGQFPQPPHDQYKLTADLSQTIWDGGYSRRAGKYEQLARSVEEKQVQVDMHGLKERINRAFFISLLLRENEQLINSIIATLEEKIRSAGSALKNGLISPMSLQILQAEKIKAEQRLAEIMSDRTSAQEVLAYLTGMNPSSMSCIKTPPWPAERQTEGVRRPELDLFELQMEKAESAGQLNAVKNQPRVFAFGQLGYGKPGLNMLSAEWDTYWIVGAGLKWTIWDWNINRRERQVFDLQKQMLANQKETFNLNLLVQSATELSSIRKYSEAVKRDEEMITLRNEILISASTQFDKGLISSSDFIQELNAHLQARISLQTDRLLLLQAEINLQTIQGKN